MVQQQRERVVGHRRSRRRRRSQKGCLPSAFISLAQITIVQTAPGRTNKGRGGGGGGGGPADKKGCAAAAAAATAKGSIGDCQMPNALARQ